MQLKKAGGPQQVSPAQPRVSEPQVLLPQLVTKSAQTLLKQLFEQHSLAWVHALPLSWQAGWQEPSLLLVEPVPVPPAQLPEQHWPFFLHALPSLLQAWALTARPLRATAPLAAIPAKPRRVWRRDRAWLKDRTSPSNRAESIGLPSRVVVAKNGSGRKRRVRHRGADDQRTRVRRMDDCLR
jgi:hypothetical protein